jgi:hypothetical protein
MDRSVHNCRIERLWLDYSHGVVAKWKPFFIELEANYNLDYNNFAHIWLLHHLFLDAVNADTQAWVATWNLHRVAVPEGGQRSPHEMFLFGMVEYGVRGIDGMVESEPEVEDLAMYGVDWGRLDLASQALERNPDDWTDENPFVTSGRPENMAEVICDEPDSPLSHNQIIRLNQLLCECVDVNSKNMDVRKVIWREALRICEEFQVNAILNLYWTLLNRFNRLVRTILERRIYYGIK